MSAQSRLENWQEAKEEVRLRWSRLSEGDLTEAAGDRGRLLACIGRRYGCDQAEADRQLREWERQAARGASGPQREDSAREAGLGRQEPGWPS
jgi:hypothetical protein